MARTKSHTLCVLFGLVLAALVAAGCSSSDPVESAETPTAGSTSPDPSEDPEFAGPDSAETESGDTATPADVPVPLGPTLADSDAASVQDLGAGEQAQDAQGNLLAVYGFVEWSASFEDLTDESQSNFPFFGDVDALADPSVELVALDVGMCSAGIDATGFGTAEFFLHDSADAALSSDPILDRGVLARHPVVQPGFRFPRAAECTRGWLPVLWSGQEPPGTARYVLTTRPAADAAVEQHVYQWDLQAVEASTAPIEDFFGPGQTVTFNAGLLAETTVVVDGFAELVGVESAIEGTRLVGVSLSYCPASDLLPEFGLAVDGWNLIAPVADSDLLGAITPTTTTTDDVSPKCFEGWLEFAVPHGGVPTGFFVSDGASSLSGYAEWTLDGAALPGPG